jgi:hypothetical protein
MLISAPIAGGFCDSSDSGGVIDNLQFTIDNGIQSAVCPPLAGVGGGNNQ